MLNQWRTFLTTEQMRSPVVPRRALLSPISQLIPATGLAWRRFPERLIIDEHDLVVKIIHVDELPPNDAPNEGAITTPAPSKQIPAEPWPSRLVATAAENRLSFRRNPHTPFAAASVIVWSSAQLASYLAAWKLDDKKKSRRSLTARSVKQGGFKVQRRWLDDAPLMIDEPLTKS
jgi:hypothetical protein